MQIQPGKRSASAQLKMEETGNIGPSLGRSLPSGALFKQGLPPALGCPPTSLSQGQHSEGLKPSLLFTAVMVPHQSKEAHSAVV